MELFHKGKLFFFSYPQKIQFCQSAFCKFRFLLVLADWPQICVNLSSYIHTVKKKKDNLVCYMYNHTQKECNKDEELMAYCKFINRIGGRVDSERIRLKLIPGKDKSYYLWLYIGHSNIFLKPGATNSSSVPFNGNSFLLSKKFCLLFWGEIFIHRGKYWLRCHF